MNLVKEQQLMSRRIEIELILHDIENYLEETLNYSQIKEKISIDTDLFWDIGLSSIEYMQLISEMEAKYDILFSLETMELKGTVREIIEIVLKQAGGTRR